MKPIRPGENNQLSKPPIFSGTGRLTYFSDSEYYAMINGDDYASLLRIPFGRIIPSGTLYLFLPVVQNFAPPQEHQILWLHHVSGLTGIYTLRKIFHNVCSCFLSFSNFLSEIFWRKSIAVVYDVFFFSVLSGRAYACLLSCYVSGLPCFFRGWQRCHPRRNTKSCGCFPLPGFLSFNTFQPTSVLNTFSYIIRK